MVVVPVPYLAYTVAVDPAGVERAVVQTLTGETVNLALIWMMRCGHVRRASRLQVGALWLFMTLTALTRGGVGSPAYQMGYCMVVVLAGMLLGFRVAFGIGLLSAVFGLFMLRAELGGLIDFGPPGQSSTVWIVSVVAFPVIAVTLYLTQRTIRQARLLAHDSDLRTRTLSEASFEGLMIHDEGIILEANQPFADIFGYDSPADLVGKRGLEFMLTPESRALIGRQMEAGVNVAREVTGVRRDGSTFSGETQSRRMQYKGRSLRIVAMRDISDRIRTQQERARFEQRMAQIQKLEIAGRLAGGVAHDFNNLLMCITGNASLLQHTAELSPDQTELLDSLLDAAGSASRLTGQLLAMGRQQEVARQVLDVNDVIRGLRGVLLGLVGNAATATHARADQVDEVVEPRDVFLRQRPSA
jgi:PAS domain S-box-containing protein